MFLPVTAGGFAQHKRRGDGALLDQVGGHRADLVGAEVGCQSLGGEFRRSRDLMSEAVSGLGSGLLHQDGGRRTGAGRALGTVEQGDELGGVPPRGPRPPGG